MNFIQYVVDCGCIKFTFTIFELVNLNRITQDLGLMWSHFYNVELTDGVSTKFLFFA
jgi:hypothetical protein